MPHSIIGGQIQQTGRHGTRFVYTEGIRRFNDRYRSVQINQLTNSIRLGKSHLTFGEYNSLYRIDEIDSFKISWGYVSCNKNHKPNRYSKGFQYSHDKIAALSRTITVLDDKRLLDDIIKFNIKESLRQELSNYYINKRP